jgi:flavin reductase (DIM6/NTAB) family NADH-FMN oxidoreductase RutF
MNFEEVALGQFDFNPIRKIDEWALLTAGTKDRFNMMTITGFLCGKFFLKPMAQVYVHPDRHTYQFMESNDYFNVSFFDTPRHSALQICGRLHGDKCDKAAEAGLHPLPFENTVIFEEAELIIICRKVYHADIAKNNFDSEELFTGYYQDPSISAYHRVYLGQIEKILRRT